MLDLIERTSNDSLKYIYHKTWRNNILKIKKEAGDIGLW